MNNNTSNRFMDGLMLGIVIGALAVFLFGTKPGKKIVKVLSEEGLSGLKDLMDDYASQEEGDEGDEGDEGEGEGLEEDILEEKEQESEPADHTQKSVEIKPKKRFFKRFRRVD